MVNPNSIPEPNPDVAISGFHEFLDDARRWTLRTVGHIALGATLIITSACGALPNNTTAPTETRQQFATAWENGHTVFFHDGRGQQFCSGTILEDSQGDKVGILTAAHCNFRDATSDPALKPDGQRWIPKPDGTYEIPVTSPITAQTGATPQTLSKPLTITEIIVPSHSNPNSDTAIGVLEGHTKEQALEAYKDNVLPIAEYKQDLIPNHTILYLAGWYDVEPIRGGVVSMRRNELALTDLGPTSDTYGDVHFPAENVGDSADEPPCLPGMSGGAAFIVVSDPTAPSGYSARIVGTLSGAIELGSSDPQADKYISICQISTAQLTASNSSILVPVLSKVEAGEERLCIPDFLLKAAAFACMQSV